MADILVGMATDQPITAAEVQTAMEGPLRLVVRSILMTTTFPPRYYRRVALVANRFGGRSRLRDALVALDHVDWDIGAAIQQLEHDAELRQAAANADPEPPGPDPNRNLDRTRASGGPNWRRSKLRLQIQVGKTWKFRNYRDVDWNFNVKKPSPKDILRLNKWRHRIILDLAGPPRPPRGVQPGQWWHPATIRALRRQYKKKLQKDPKKPDYGGIVKAQNELFKDITLPGHGKKVPQRGYGQVAGAINRNWKSNKSNKIGPRKPAEEALKMIRKEAKKERERCEATDAADFTSTPEEYDEVENEVFVYETDTESDEEDD